MTHAIALPTDPRLTNAGVATRARIAALADQCVKCGLCLPGCPTYRVDHNEAESPRGRIALAQALASGQLAATPALTMHLDQCLICLNCEHVCPSQVRYGELIVTARSLLRESRRPLRRERALLALMARPRWLRAGLRLANLPGLRSWIRSAMVRNALRPFGLDRFARELPRLLRVASLPQLGKATTPPRGRVALFIGCAAATVDRDVHVSAIRLLQALGYEVVLPRGQGCCGALAVHAGDIERAGALAAATRRVVVDSGVNTLLVSASGCYGTLRDHTFAGTTIRVREIHEFLAADAHLGDLRLRPLARRAALHTPCTQTNVAHAGSAIRALLEKIPQLEITGLPAKAHCCGAAGDYFLKHAQIADRLRAETLTQVEALVPDLLVTSNVGCRIFLDNGLRQCGRDIPVVHPVALLAQQLDN